MSSPEIGARDVVLLSSDSGGTWMPRANPDLWTRCAVPDCEERATALTGPMCPAHWCIVPDCEERAVKTGVQADGRCEQHLTWCQGG